MAPNWIRIAKVLPKSSSSKPKKRWTRSRWPVEDTGRNSVRPSTTPRTKALNRSKIIDELRRQEVNERRAAAGEDGSGTCAFPLSLTPEQRGRANIAQVARGLYPRSAARLNLGAPRG